MNSNQDKAVTKVSMNENSEMQKDHQVRTHANSPVIPKEDLNGTGNESYIEKSLSIDTANAEHASKDLPCGTFFEQNTSNVDKDESTDTAMTASDSATSSNFEKSEEKKFKKPKKVSVKAEKLSTAEKLDKSQQEHIVRKAANVREAVKAHREGKRRGQESSDVEEEEEEERRQRQKREEEEFTKLPEDTTQMSHYDLNARLDGPNPDGNDDDDNQPVAAGKTKKRRSKKNKKKGDQDDLQAFDMNTGNFTTDMGNTTQGLNDTEAPMNGKKVKKDKKKKRKDKKKNRHASKPTEKEICASNYPNTGACHDACVSPSASAEAECRRMGHKSCAMYCLVDMGGKLPPKKSHTSEQSKLLAGFNKSKAKKCAREGGKCKCKGTVSYGKPGTIEGAVFKKSTGRIRCNNRTFGDPFS
jgi:hypothetical protein